MIPGAPVQPYSVDILGITLKKGGTSVLAMVYGGRRVDNRANENDLRLRLFCAIHGRPGRRRGDLRTEQ